MIRRRPDSQWHGGIFPSSRFRGIWMTRVSALFLFSVVFSALLAPLLTPYTIRFEPNETHPMVADMPPGTQDVPTTYPAFDGDKSAFALIDLDNSGFIECKATSGKGMNAPTFSVHCDELLSLSERFRFFRFLLVERDGLGGHLPDGALTFEEFPKADSEIEEAHRDLGFTGREGFAFLDENKDGRVTQTELLRQTRSLRLNWTMLEPFDVNGDLRISHLEFPGVPQLQPFWLGTDGQGRDLLARVIWGGRISLMVALLATLISVLIGTFLGAASGYIGGRTDRLFMSFVDLLYGLPFLLLVIMLLVWFGRSTVHLFIALGAVQWLTLCRIVRGQVRTLKQEQYVMAAESLGAHPGRVVYHHILRNAVGPIVAYTSLMIPAVIQEEAFLSYLGLGVQAPDPSWGTLIAEGVSKLETSWWMMVYPGIVFGVTIFSLYILGERITGKLTHFREGLER